MPSGISWGWATLKDVLAGLVWHARCAYRRARVGDNKPDKYADRRYWMHEFAKDHRRWGHRRAWINALAQGYGVCRETLSAPVARRWPTRATTQET